MVYGCDLLSGLVNVMFVCFCHWETVMNLASLCVLWICCFHVPYVCICIYIFIWIFTILDCFTYIR